MLTLLYLLVCTRTLIMFEGRTCDFTSGMKIPCLMYSTYDHMDVCFRSYAIF